MSQTHRSYPLLHVANDGKRMLLIPAGWFLMGTSEADIADMAASFRWKPKWFADETPQHPVFLRAFYIDETTVTNAEYKRFLDATQRRSLPTHWDQSARVFPVGQENHPVVNVSWDDANEYARWAGKRLPTEAEWEKAGRGSTVDGEARRYPWGKDFDVDRCNTSASGIGRTTPVAQYAPQGNSPFGVMDMAGNVWEWCADWYAANYYHIMPSENPTGPADGDWRVLRGGAWDVSPDYARCASRDYIVPETGYALVGFRCVMPV